MSKVKIAKGISATWVKFFVFSLLSVVQTPILFRSLKDYELSSWYIFFSLSGLVQMTDLGLPAALSRAVSFVKGLDDRKDLGNEPGEVTFYTRFSFESLLYSSLTSFVILCTFVCLLAFVITAIAQPGFSAPPESQQNIRIAFLVFLCGFCMNMVGTIPSSCLTGLGDIEFESIARVLAQLVFFAGVVVLLPIYRSLLALSFLYLCQGTLFGLTAWVILRFRHRSLFVRKWALSVELVRRLYRESIPLFVNQFGGWLILQSNVLIATYIIGAQRIPDYSIAVQLVFLGSNVALAVSVAMAPHASSSFARNEHSRVQKYFLSNVRLSMSIVSIWATFVVIWSREIINTWVGPGRFVGMAVVIMLSINLILETHHSINGSFVWTTGKWPFAPWTLAAGLINVSLASVGAIWLGFPGLVLGSLIAKLVTLNWYVVYFTLKRLTIQWREYRRGILVPILWSVLLTLAATLGVRLLIDPIQTWAVLYYGARVGGLLVLAAAGMITLVIGSGCFYFIVFSPFERGFIKARFVRN